MDMRSVGELPLERRFNSASAEFRPEVRSAGDDKAHIAGYASVFNKLSRRLGGFVERVDSRAFNDWEAQGWECVVARYQHSDDFILGTIQGRTLTLRTDDTGLWYDVIPPSFRQDVVELCQRGDVSSSSFAFRTPEGGDDWGLSDFNYPLRTLLAIELVDVAPVVTPAYPDATASATGAVESLARRFSADPTEIRSLLDRNQGVKLFKRSDRSSVTPVAPQAPITEEPEMTKDDESRKKLTSKERKDLPDSAFAYIDDEGVGHFPIQDAAHVRNALARIAQGAQYGKEALPKVKAAAAKFGIDTEEQNVLGQLGAELREIELPAWFITIAAEEAEERADSKPAKPVPGDDDADEEDEDEPGETAEDDEERADSKKPAKPAAKKPPFAKADDADADAEDEEDDEEDDEDEADAKPKPGMKGGKKDGMKKAVKKVAGGSDKSDTVGKNLPPWLQEKQKRMLVLQGKRYDPYYFGEPTGTTDDEAA